MATNAITGAPSPRGRQAEVSKKDAKLPSKAEEKVAVVAEAELKEVETSRPTLEITDEALEKKDMYGPALRYKERYQEAFDKLGPILRRVTVSGVDCYYEGFRSRPVSSSSDEGW